jgi:hypothetical protein
MPLRGRLLPIIVPIVLFGFWPVIAEADGLARVKAEAAADTFLTICGERDFTAALAADVAADRAWPSLGKDIVSRNQPGIAVSKSYGWMLTPRDLYPSLIFLFAYEGLDPELGQVDVCTIFFREPNSRDVMVAMSDLTEVAMIERIAENGGVSETFSLPDVGGIIGIAHYGASDLVSIYLTAVHKK